MDCRYIDEILVDYIEDILDSDQRKLVDSHLAICYECSGKIKEFSTIKNAFKSEVLPQVSKEVILKLEKESHRQTHNDSAFWKKWFYSPVLIPALTAAIAIMVWIDYREDGIISLDNADFYSEQVIAKKATQRRPLNSPETNDRQPDNKVIELPIGNELNNNTPQEYDPYDLYAGRASERNNIPEEAGKVEQEELSPVKHSSVTRSKSTGQRKDDTMLTDQNGPKNGEIFDDLHSTTPVTDSTEPEGAFESKSNTDKDRKDSYGIDDLNHKGNAYRILHTEKSASKSIITSNQDLRHLDESRLKKPEPPQVIIDKRYLDELNTALQQQEIGNCDAAIVINENLLQNKPAPSDNIKAQCYLSLAECYEKHNKYSKAIENYSLLQKFSPSQSKFAGEKIDELKTKIGNTGDTATVD